MGHSIGDFFPAGDAPRVRVKNVEPPPASSLLPEPADLDAALAPARDALTGRRVAVVTGAGISTDSGIPDYRSPGAAPRTPMTLQQFMSSPRWRQHYWARNHVGWKLAARVEPNAGHRALVDWERRGRLAGVITQNVDLLHVRAGQHRVVHLHGRYDLVRCTSCGAMSTRADLDARLTALNPGWETATVADAEIAPDADAVLASTEGFVVADCDLCGGILRTDVVFFGDNVPAEKVAAGRAIVEAADALLVAGSSLAVASARRFVRQAERAGLPIVVINRGPTRADDVAAAKIDVGTSRALPWLVAHA